MTPAVLEYVVTNVDAARHVFATRHEMAIEPSDFLEVSTSLGLEGHDAALQA